MKLQIFNKLEDLSISFFVLLNNDTYSSVPNRRIGPNKRAGGKILKKH